ncbi:MAG: hypothetical protein ABFS08_02120 [Pseudomonadota bacterium]
MKGLIFTLSLLLSGCASTMEATFSPELRYGQLYALENALTIAGSNCNDKDAVFTATYWASTTVINISDHSEFLEEGSVERTKSKELVKQLYSLRYVTANEESRCHQIAIAGNATRELLTLLSY